MIDEREDRLYQARLYCEQAKIIIGTLRSPILSFLMDMLLMELRASTLSAREKSMRVARGQQQQMNSC